MDPTTGQIDTTFSPFGETANGTDREVYALALVGDSLFAGGEFTQYRGAEYQHLVKLVAKTGTPDPSFGAAGPNSGFGDAVHALAAKDGALFVGGDFTTYRGVSASASYMAKLAVSNGNLDTAFTPAGATARGVSFRVAVPYGPSLMLGGYLDYCDTSQCYGGGLRVNRTTRLPE